MNTLISIFYLLRYVFSVIAIFNNIKIAKTLHSLINKKHKDLKSWTSQTFSRWECVRL